MMVVWLAAEKGDGGKEKYSVANSWTTGSISRTVVEMPWAIRAEGVEPVPRPTTRADLFVISSSETDLGCEKGG